MPLSIASVATHAFILCLFIAALTEAAEFTFVFVMNIVHHSIPFTSFFGVCLFSALSGLLPTWPAPSRISSTPIAALCRIVLVIEVTALVVIVNFASEKWMAYKKIFLPIDQYFPIYIYFFILTLSFFVRFRKLKSEAMEFRGRGVPGA